MNADKLLLSAGLVFTMLTLAACAGNKSVRNEDAAAPVQGSAIVAKDSKAVVKGSDADKKPVAPAVSEAAATAKPAAEGRSDKQGKAEALGNLETIYFDYDSSVLSKAALDQLDRNFAALRSNSAVRIAIEGHCDERGSGEYNLALGERRAKAAQQYLVTRGLQAERIAVISYGSERPAAEGHDEAAWSKNRRDVFTLTGK
jgi:peptidoglycan-associated lipoprotein